MTGHFRRGLKPVLRIIILWQPIGLPVPGQPGSLFSPPETTMTPTPQQDAAAPSGSHVPHALEPRRIQSDALLGGRRRLIIDHEGSSYTLLLTRNGKLILTK
jgi:hemin uptake protein HemP